MNKSRIQRIQRILHNKNIYWALKNEDMQKREYF